MNKTLTKREISKPRHPMDFAWMNQATAAVNSLRNIRMVQGNKSTGQVYVSDGNTVIELPASGFQTFQIVSDGGDWYNCYLFNGVSAVGGIVKVAKNQDLRCLLSTNVPAGGAWTSKLIRGITYTYTYTAIAGATLDGINVVEYKRDVAGSDSSAETDYVTPCLNCLNAGSDPAGLGDIISAFPTSFSGPASLIGVTWQAVADGRAWAAQAAQ
jgi:hypothetical protein